MKDDYPCTKKVHMGMGKNRLGSPIDWHSPFSGKIRLNKRLNGQLVPGSNCIIPNRLISKHSLQTEKIAYFVGQKLCYNRLVINGR